MRKYKPAVFQPTVRQDWAGILSYISDQEKAEILTAIFKYPTVECSSKFWLETIKPDLDLQYESFQSSCKAKSRGVCNRWGKISITDVEDMYNTCNTDVIDAKGKSKSKGKGKSKEEDKSENIEKNNQTENIVIEKKIYNNFIPPTEQEVLKYAKQQNDFAGMGGFKCSEKEALEFFNFYAGQGWITSGNIPITDWQKKLKGWVLKQKQFKTKQELEDEEELKPIICE